MQSNERNDQDEPEILGDEVLGLKGNELPPAPSDKSRGAFDIRAKGPGAGQEKKKLYLSIGAVVLVFLLIVIGGWWWVIASMSKGSTDIDESSVQADAALDRTTSGDTSMQQLKAQKLQDMKAEEERKAKEAEALRLAQEAQTSNQGVQGSQRAGAGVGQSASNAATGPNTSAEAEGQTAAQRKLTGGVVVTPKLQDASSYAASSGGTRQASKQSGAVSTVPTSDVSLGDTGGGFGGMGGSSSRGSLSNLGGTNFAPGKAVLAPPGKYLLRRNTYTSCVLYTEIVTDQPSLNECKLTEPLYSADGSTMLADAGDSLFGEQSVEVKPGQVRVFTSWTELDTQSGVRARLASLGAGPMGASGTEAWIDNHYPERFGGAVMLSLFQDVLEAAKNSTQKSGNGYTVNNSEKNTESMANKVLENTIGIQPTAHILPGTVMNVIVARDIDFSSVFENR